MHDRMGPIPLETYHRLIAAGIVGGSPIELLNGHIWVGTDYKLAFSPRQREAATALGINLPANEPASHTGPIELELTRPDAELLHAYLYNAGEHVAAGVPLMELTSEQASRLGAVIEQLHGRLRE
jgi:hypothetical protein